MPPSRSGGPGMVIRLARTEAEKRRAHADIARRYGAAARDVTSRNRLRLGELRRLFMNRGMTRSQADAAVDELGEFDAMSAAGLGSAVALNFDERVRLNIRTIRCCDRTEEEVADF